MEIVAGGETGGEWMSVAQGHEPDFGIVATIGLGGSVCTKTSAGCVELPSDELLIAGRRSGTVVVWQQEWDIPFFSHSPAMRLQQSRSAAVIAIAGRVQAMIGAANSSRDNNETPTLATGFIV
jgi:hypothetical protein